MSTQKKGRGARKLLTVAMCVAVVTSISACSASEEEISKRVAELEARGFIDPILESDSASGADLYAVGVGSVCRISVTAPINSNHAYWSYAGLVDVSASTIEAKAEALGLEHCFKD